MKRLLIESLKKWKEKSDRKPLILKGVRQCGKTYLLKEFGMQCYSDVAYFNFEERPAVADVFAKDYDTERMIFELGVIAGKDIFPETTLIIFDEIQECGKALTALKYFCENAPEYHIVCAGSLLGIALQKQLSFPVGKVDFLTLRPMSFFEFVVAREGDNAEKALNGYDAKKTLPAAFGEKLEGLLREYYIVGGMPAAVKSWCDCRSIEEVENIQQTIINSYELDFAKHAPVKEFPKLTAIWRSIPEQLAKENSKFFFSHVKKGCRAKDLEDSLEWLLGAGLVHKVAKIEKPFIPLSAYADDTSFKLYLADIGILRKLSGLPPEAILEATPYYSEFKGVMTENYALCAMLSSGCETAYYWSSGNMAEVDFVVQSGKYILPIEVKSERNVKARSLAEYRKKYSPKYAIKTSMLSAVGGEEIVNIPLYLLEAMGKIIE